MPADDIRGRSCFAIGTGRCGTQFLERVLAREPDVAATHERDPLNEAFHRWCRWYGVPVDDEGFLATKEAEIRGDLARRTLSFEASAYLSLSVRQLHERFGSRFVLLVRRPERVVTSYWTKGWYEEPYPLADPSLIPGYVPGRFPHHYFSRFAPRPGPELEAWNRSTRVGRLAWYWNALNAAALDELDGIPTSHYRVVRLEDLTYDVYRELAEWMGIRPRLGEAEFASVAERRPNSLPQTRGVSAWSPAEREEFEREVRPMAERLGYDFRCADLASDRRPAPAPVPSGLLHRLARSLRRGR